MRCLVVFCARLKPHQVFRTRMSWDGGLYLWRPLSFSDYMKVDDLLLNHCQKKPRLEAHIYSVWLALKFHYHRDGSKISRVQVKAASSSLLSSWCGKRVLIDADRSILLQATRSSSSLRLFVRRLSNPCSLAMEQVDRWEHPRSLLKVSGVRTLLQSLSVCVCFGWFPIFFACGDWWQTLRASSGDRSGHRRLMESEAQANTYFWRDYAPNVQQLFVLRWALG